MSQTIRGLPRRATKSSSDAAPPAPSRASAWTASLETSCTTHWRPPRMNRRTMLAPMRPRPIMPTCIAPPLATQPLVETPWTPRRLLHRDRALPYLRRPPASIAVSPAAQVQPRRADRQAVERDLREPARQLRVDVEPAPRRVGAEAEDRLQQVEDAPCGPRLWHVRLRIHDREGAGAALDAGVELRQPVAHEVARRLRDVARHAGRLGGEAVALEAERDDAVV